MSGKLNRNGYLSKNAPNMAKNLNSIQEEKISDESMFWFLRSPELALNPKRIKSDILGKSRFLGLGISVYLFYHLFTQAYGDVTW